MGVKHLWHILSPVGEKKSLYDLQDKVLAVDLSCWVCENQSINESGSVRQPRMYLRNLYFRTSYLLLLGIIPVFVLEGVPLELKFDEMEHRNNARFKRKNIQRSNPKNMTRKRFYSTLLQCQKFLELLGLKCIQSEHEAEAMCAQLNCQQFVDGVITQDSDAFLYGATTVYRNLSIQGTGTVDVYTMPEIERKLKLSREKLVVMSLLTGCDYDAGIEGIGKETAYTFLEACEDNVLERIRTWRNNRELDMYEIDKKENHCKKCLHVGRYRDHIKNGCTVCCTDNNCLQQDSEVSDESQKLLDIELKIRRKALQNQTFPNEKIISEYLDHDEQIKDLDLRWYRPQVIKLMKFTEKMLDWDLAYSFEKCFPLLTRWSLINKDFNTVNLKSVLKKRKVKGVDCFEVAWEILDGPMVLFVEDIISDSLLTTVEPQCLISDQFPDLVKSLESSKLLKTKKSKKLESLKRANSFSSIDELVQDFNTNCTVSERAEFEILIDDCVSDEEVDLSILIDSIVSRSDYI